MSEPSKVNHLTSVLLHDHKIIYSNESFGISKGSRLYRDFSASEQIKIAPRESSDVRAGASQVGIVWSAADGGVDGAGGGALGPGEGHIIIQGVFRVGHAAAGAAPGPVQARGREAPGLRLRLVALHHLLHPPLAAVLAAAAAADPDEHDEAGQDLKDAADEAQDDAVADARVRERRDGRDGGEEVGVPGDRDDGEDPRDEDQQASQAGHNPVRAVSPATDARDGHDQADDGDHQRGHHQTLRHRDDLMAEVGGVLQAALRPGVGGSGPADVPNALLEEGVRLDVGDVVQSPPVGRHRGGEVEDPAAGGEHQAEDQDPGSPQRSPHPLLRRALRHDAAVVLPGR